MIDEDAGPEELGGESTAPSVEEYKALKESNEARLRALAHETGQPIQINGMEEHLLTFLIVTVVGEEGMAHALTQWEHKVSANLDRFESMVRQQKLLHPG